MREVSKVLAETHYYPPPPPRPERRSRISGQDELYTLRLSLQTVHHSHQIILQNIYFLMYCSCQEMCAENIAETTI